MVSSQVHIDDRFGRSLVASDGDAANAGHRRELPLELPNLVNRPERPGRDRGLAGPRRHLGEKRVEALEDLMQGNEQRAKFVESRGPLLWARRRRDVLEKF